MQNVRPRPPILPTPFALIDYSRLLRNLTRMQTVADRAGTSLRPHIKTHKTAEVAELQIGLGASGLTASKPSEALPFVRAGVSSLLIAYPIIDPGQIATVLDAALSSGTVLSFILDAEAGRAALNEAGRRVSRVLPVHIKIDVGLGRCGVASNSEALVAIAREVNSSPNLELAGLVSHPGHGYGATSTAQLEIIAREERRQLIEARERLAFLGRRIWLSVGSTPTVLAATDFTEIDEIRPGNYALFDLTAVRLGVAQEDEIAFGVVATVVSKNSEFYIVDAGSKALTSDLGPHSSGGLNGFGCAIAIDRLQSDQRFAISRLSEEHGFVDRAGSDLHIGERLLILPNHSCPVVNLYDRLVVQREGNVEFWNVAARGALT